MTVRSMQESKMEIRESKVYRNFIISVGLIVALGVSVIYLGMAVRSNNLIRETILARAKAHFDGILMTRQWNALYGGVYVEKKPGMRSNPYLADPDIRSADGKIYTKKNPALMTREISELSQKNSLFFFHMTSLKPLNPDNVPDAFEKQALVLFEQNRSKEFYTDVIYNDRTYFRYMAPLYVEKACLQCHAAQGYREGDIRGGISVRFDVSDVQQKIQNNNITILLLTAVSALLLIAVIYIFFHHLRAKLEQARALLDKLSKTDILTEIANRRYLLERFKQELERAKRTGKPLCCLMLDIDYFKSVNDTYGHLKGDDVLRELSKILKESLRTYDIIGRYGGEEFLIILPDTDPENALKLAERIRLSTEESLADNAALPAGRRVTVSIGLTKANAADKDYETIIERADANLYRAKEKGRNRVETEEVISSD